MKTCLASALFAIAGLLSLANLSVSANSLLFEEELGVYGIGRAEPRGGGANITKGAGRVFFHKPLSGSHLLDVRDGKLETRYQRWAFSPDMTFLESYVETDRNPATRSVRSSDVFGVPVPHAVFLFGAGLVGLAAVARPRSIGSDDSGHGEARALPGEGVPRPSSRHCQDKG
jgi:hypothetical protein